MSSIALVVAVAGLVAAAFVLALIDLSFLEAVGFGVSLLALITLVAVERFLLYGHQAILTAV
jgi:hypothetical protein